MNIILVTFAFVLGACVGSFLNVLIHRLPRKKSIIFPGSRCPHCEKSIKIHNNVPLLSYILLKGRCVDCKAKISSRYFIVEVITALSYVLLLFLNNYKIDIELFKNIIFFSYGLTIIFIDIEHYIIPDSLSLSLIVIGLIFSFFSPKPGWIYGLIGASFGFILFFIIGHIYYKWKGQIGLGGGDVKYIAALGFFVGLSGMIFILISSSFFAITFFLFIVLIGKKVDNNSKIEGLPNNKYLPFAPFLTISAFLFIISGEWFLDWYNFFIYKFLDWFDIFIYKIV